MTCPNTEAWLCLASGESSPDERALMTAHAQGCVPCTRELRFAVALATSAEAPNIDVERFTKSVLVATKRSPHRAPVRFLAAAAVLALTVVSAAFMARTPEFTARGGTATRDWTARVAAELRPVSAVTASVTEGMSIATQTRWALWYRNAVTDRPLFVMAYVVDASGALHWVAPTYLKEGHEPAPVTLPTALAPQLVGEVAQFDDEQSGTASIVTLISTTPGSVLAFEAAPSVAAAEPEQLLPGAIVWRRVVHITTKETTP